MLNLKSSSNSKNGKRSRSSGQPKKLFSYDLDGLNEKRFPINCSKNSNQKSEDGNFKNTSFSRLATFSQKTANQLQQRCRTANILRADFDDVRIFQEQTPFFDAFGFSQGTRETDLERKRSGLKIKPIVRG